MANFDDVRRLALRLPETTDGTHLRRPSVLVSGRDFIGVERDGRVTLALDPGAIPAAIAEAPGAIEEIRRFDRPIGIRVDPAGLDEHLLGRLVERSWRSRAPKRLVAATFPEVDR